MKVTSPSQTGSSTPMAPFSTELMKLLRSPVSGRPLLFQENDFVTDDGEERYPVSDSGIPLFAGEFISEDAKVQQNHYDRVAKAYVENLAYPHTQEYMGYLDDALFAEISDAGLGRMAEICCGRGEAIGLLNGRYDVAVGVDVSQQMLEAARDAFDGENVVFVQGDATKLPIAENSFDTVVMLGGIHHVNNREALYGQIMRILKPGGRFIFREPVDDFALWRWIRNIIYRLAPALDYETEAPLRKSSTMSQLQHNGFEIEGWKTFGFFGFCFFMNSDVLVFNRLFRFVPGIRFLTRLSTKLDGLITGAPGMTGNGLIVVGSARKPQSSA